MKLSNILLVAITLPLWALGWLAGFLVRPFLVGYWVGFNHIYVLEATNTMKEAQKRLENE